MSRLLAVLGMLGALVATGGDAWARDIALVIGNDGYSHVPRLEKAANDSRAVAAALRAAGFEVTQAANLDQRAMSRALVTFEGGVRDGDRALFYFSGHGFALGSANYLLPTDVPAVESNQEGLIRDAAFAVDGIVDDIRARGARVTVLVLDACRNNPFATASTRSLPMTRGLARIEAPEGVFVLTSAGPQQAALDSLSGTDADPNSVFTREFLKELRPGRTLVDIARQTRVAVASLAATIGFAQVPAYSDQVIGDVILSGRPVSSAGTAPAGQVAGNAATTIVTSADTQAGAGVSFGAGAVVGPGVIVGDKDARLLIQKPGETGGTAPGSGAKIAALVPDAGVAVAGRAPIASFMRSSAGWSVNLSLPEPAVGISYRVGAQGDFRETGLMDVLDPRTGQRMPNTSLQLSGRAPASVIEVRYQRPDGSSAGPFPIRFDPEVALFDSQRKILQSIWPSWVEFRSFNGLLVYFTTLISYRCAITEVRYGLDGAPPLSRFDLPPCNPAEPFSIPNAAKLILNVPTTTTSIGLQITWRDGTRSEVNTIER